MKGQGVGCTQVELPVLGSRAGNCTKATVHPTPQPLLPFFLSQGKHLRCHHHMLSELGGGATMGSGTEKQHRQASSEHSGFPAPRLPNISK